MCRMVASCQPEEEEPKRNTISHWQVKEFMRHTESPAVTCGLLSRIELNKTKALNKRLRLLIIGLTVKSNNLEVRLTATNGEVYSHLVSMTSKHS